MTRIKTTDSTDTTPINITANVNGDVSLIASINFFMLFVLVSFYYIIREQIEKVTLF